MSEEIFKIHFELFFVHVEANWRMSEAGEEEKSCFLLQVRVKAQKPGDKQLQEVLYSTEAHTDRSFCRTGMDILPWKQISTGPERLQHLLVQTCWLSVQLWAHSLHHHGGFISVGAQPNLSLRQPLR